MNKILCAPFCLMLFLSVTNSASVLAGENVKYQIVKETPNVKFSKNNIEIELSKRTNKATLKKIANSLRSTRKQYDRLWIFYFLPEMKRNAGAWATSHFTPNLKVEILGTTEEENKALNKVTVQGKEIIGKWRDTRPMVGSMKIIYKHAGKLIMKTTYNDGSSGEEEVTKKSIHGKIRYQEIGNAHGEYYMLEKNGNLGMYGPNGKFGEVKKAKQ